MASSFYIIEGGVWKKVSEASIYTGSAWESVSNIYYWNGSAWVKGFTKGFEFSKTFQELQIILIQLQKQLLKDGMEQIV